MATTYKKASQDVRDIAARMIEQYHKPLAEFEVTIEYLFAYSDGPSALKLNGWPCQAIARIIGSKDRAKGMTDAEICIDADKWEELSDAEREALLDHELHHFIVQVDEDDSVKRDANNRPKLGMRKHDIQVGWFAEVAKRHGAASAEVKQAQQIFDDFGEAFFPFMTQLKLVPKPTKKAA